MYPFWLEKIIKILSPIVTMLAFLQHIDLVIPNQLKLDVYKFNSQVYKYMDEVYTGDVWYNGKHPDLNVM